MVVVTRITLRLGAAEYHTSSTTDFHEIWHYTLFLKVMVMKIVIPREHGAWGMLFAPLLIGMFVAGLKVNHSLLVFGMLAAYLAVYPLLQWIKNRQRNGHMLKWALGYGMAAAILGIPLLFHYPALVGLFLATGLFLWINIQFAIRKKERHLLNDLAAIAGLSLGAVAAYYVGQGFLTKIAWYLWMASILQFFGSALHVKTMIREKGNRTMKTVANLYHILLLAIPFLVHLVFPAQFHYQWQSLAYLFSSVRTLLTPFDSYVRPLTIGILEIINTVWFVVGTSIVFH